MKSSKILPFLKLITTILILQCLLMVNAQERSGRFRSSQVDNRNNPPFFGVETIPILDLDTFFEDSAPARFGSTTAATFIASTTTPRPIAQGSSSAARNRQPVRLILVDDGGRRGESSSSSSSAPASSVSATSANARFQTSSRTVPLQVNQRPGVAFRLPSTFRPRQDQRVFEPITSQGQSGGIVFFDVVNNQREQQNRERPSQTLQQSRFNQPPPPPPPRRPQTNLDGQIFVVNGNAGSFQSQSRPQVFRLQQQVPAPQFTPISRNITSVPFRPSQPVTTDTSSRARFHQAPSRPLPPPPPPPPPPRRLPQTESIPEEDIPEFNFQRLQPQQRHQPSRQQPVQPQPRPIPQQQQQIQQQPDNDLSFQAVRQQPQRRPDIQSFDNQGGSFAPSAQDIDDQRFTSRFAEEGRARGQQRPPVHEQQQQEFIQDFRTQAPSFDQQPMTSEEEDLNDATFATITRQLGPSSRLFPSTIPTGDTSRETAQQPQQQPQVPSETPGSRGTFDNFDFRQQQQQQEDVTQSNSAGSTGAFGNFAFRKQQLQEQQPDDITQSNLAESTGSLNNFAFRQQQPQQPEEVTQANLDYEDERFRTTFSDYEQTQDDSSLDDPSQQTSSFQRTSTEPSTPETTQTTFIPRRAGLRRRLRVKTSTPPADTTAPQQSVLQPPPMISANPESVHVTPVGFRRQQTASGSPVDVVQAPSPPVPPVRDSGFESGDASIRDETVQNLPDEDVVSFGDSTADAVAPQRSRVATATKSRLPTTEARKSSMLRRGDTRRRSKQATAKVQVAEDRSASRSNSIDDISLQTSRASGPVVAGSPATACDSVTCRLPNCYCGGNKNPGNLEPAQTPQMVLLTFDDAVNDLNWPLYTRLFNQDRQNPNGCPILATFYVSHEWTDYAKVQALYSQGHEIASHSISHGDGRDFSKTKWYDEIYGEREILSAYGNVQLGDIRGMRSPFLALGGEKQYSMLYETNFTYDSSMTVSEAHPPVWPFTLDHLHPHPCAIPPCPRMSYPGFWEIPMQALNDNNGAKCSMADGCSSETTADGIYEMLTKNFERHYTSNRAPFGLFYHASWFLVPYRQEGFVRFLDEILKKDDVYFVTSLQLLDWVKNPQPLSTVNDFASWNCDNNHRAEVCQRPQKCELRFKGDVRYMSTCSSCPEKYPWVGDTGVTNHVHSIS